MKIGRQIVLSAASVLALSAGALAQPEVQPFLLIERAALSDWIVDDRDAALERALAMIPVRVNELPQEPGIPDFPAEVSVLVDMVFEVLAKPGRMAVTYNGGNPAGGLFGYGVAFSVASGDRASATGMQDNVLRLLDRARQQNQMPFHLVESQRFQGLKEIQMPFGLLSFGPRDVGGTWWYDVVLGSVDDPAQGFEALPPALTGVKPFMRGRLDFAGINPAAQMAQAMLGGGEGGAQTRTVMAELEKAGLIGENALKIDFQMGYTAEESQTVIEVRGARRVAEYIGLPTEPLAAADYRAVPADSVLASIAKVDLSQIDRLLDQLVEQGLPVGDALARFEEQTGVDLREDILRTLGGTAAFYMSDATGGGNLLSSVALVSFKDRARFLGAHDKLLKLANDSLARHSEQQPMAAYVRLSRWSHEGTDLISIRFNGLPVPLEITYAATADWLIVGATPQAVVAAARQANGRGDAGIGEHPALKRLVATARGASSMTFMDTPRLARTGYWAASLAGSALANGVRSMDGSRDPGLVVPPYHDLMRNARPTVDLSYWRGDDYIYEAHADRSVLVQGAGVAGLLTHVAPLIAAVAAPAMSAARSQYGAQGDGGFDAIALLGAARTMAFVDPLERALLTSVLVPQAGDYVGEAQNMVRQWEEFMRTGR